MEQKHKQILKIEEQRRETFLTQEHRDMRKFPSSRLTQVEFESERVLHI